jgi:hypothetical protein
MPLKDEHPLVIDLSGRPSHLTDGMHLQEQNTNKTLR